MDEMNEDKRRETAVKARADETWDGGRLDVFWADRLKDEGASRQRIQECIREGRALVNGQARTKPNFRLAAGDELTLSLPDQNNALESDPGRLPILYSDDDIAVVDKPYGLTTHPAPSCSDPTLVNRLLHHFPQLAEMDGERPGVVHRLDKETSGVMVAALNERARLALSQAFANRETMKIYLALLSGRPPQDQGVIEAPIGRHPRHKTRMAVFTGGRPAKTAWSVVWKSPKGHASLALLRIHTGRTHQIRVHMAHLGCPVAGDPTYGDGQSRLAFSRMMLHALRLGFNHPSTGERLTFTAWPGPDFMDEVRRTAKATLRAGIVGMPGGGKSTLARLIHEQGVPLFDADRAVADLYRPGADGFHMLRARYGDRFTDEAEGVDKQALFAAMRETPALRREVMDMIHPMVEAKYKAFLENASASNPPWIAAEVPLLVEGDWPGKGLVDLVIGVHASQALRRGPFAKARSLAPETLDILDAWQYPEKKKFAACHLAVENPGNEAGLRERAQALGRVVLWIRSRRMARTMDQITAAARAGLEELSSR
jgi:23S rRNA pseudouridine1911/1915/1917 synthase